MYNFSVCIGKRPSYDYITKTISCTYPETVDCGIVSNEHLNA